MKEKQEERFSEFTSNTQRRRKQQTREKNKQYEEQQ
jgi:hypothetical protein